MAGKLITLPLRVTFESARLLTRVATGAAGQALSLAGRTIGAVTPGRSGSARPQPAPTMKPEPSTRPAPTTARPEPTIARRDPRTARPEPTIARPDPRTVRPAPTTARPEPTVRPRPTVRSEPVVRPTPPELPAVREPVHVSEEPVLVSEFAEPGAEDGAGAAINVAEPWNGYEHMSAKDVIARARGANPAQLAAVRLYESRHRSRQTVLAAVDRQLRLGNGGAPA